MIIYKTTNLVNGKIYVGKDVKNSETYLGSGILLKNAIKKYGVENFKKEILEYCESKEQLEERERYWIKKLNSIKIGYNLTEGGTGGDTFSMKTESLKNETREKLRNRIFTEETRNKRLSNLKNFQPGVNHPAYGRKQSEYTKEKRKKSLLEKGMTSPMSGKKHSDETKLKISEKKKGTESHRKGKTHSDETKLKMKGRKMSEETKLKMKGRKMSEETKLKIKGKVSICEYCGTKGTGNTMKRWHFENCKYK